MFLRILTAALAVATLAACSTGPGPGYGSIAQAGADQCRQFAVSGGYPVLRGGPTYGPNSGIEQLPGRPPLIFGAFDDDIKAHLDEEEYLQNWCMQGR